MNRCSKSVVLVLIGSPLLLAGCRTHDDRNNPVSGYGGGGVGYVSPGSGGQGSQSGVRASPRGGFGGFGRIGGFSFGG